MNTYKHYIGIDISKQTFDVFIMPNTRSFCVKNTSSTINTFIKKLSSLQEPFVVMEATGGYEQKLVKALHKHNIPVAVENPRKIRNFARAKGLSAKTDKLDARIICLYAQTMKPTAQQAPSEAQEELKEFVNYYHQQVKTRVEQKNRFQQQSNPKIRKMIKQQIRQLDKCITTIRETIKSIIKQNLQLKHSYQLYTTIPGVGEITAAVLISHLRELGKLDRKQIAALAGLAPFNRDSGQFKGKRFIQGGRRYVRHCIYMATLVATRHNTTIEEFYRRLVEKGKPKKLAIIACARKLIVILNAMAKNNRKWDTNYSHSTTSFA